MDAPTLRGERVVLRAMADSDVERFLEIVRTPEVERWWGEGWECRHMDEKLTEDDLACWIVEVDGNDIGFVQAYEETEHDRRHAGIDLFLDPSWHGQGLGTDALRVVARHLFDELGHHRLVIDPAAANAIATRCFEGVGFRRVGITRSSWWDHVEGRWADGVLLDLLRDELT